MESKGPRRFFWAKWFFGGLGYHGQNHTFPGNEWFVGLAAFGGKDNKPFFSCKGVVFWPWYPMPPKNLLAKNPFGVPLRDGPRSKGKYGDGSTAGRPGPSLSLAATVRDLIEVPLRLGQTLGRIRR